MEINYTSQNFLYHYGTDFRGINQLQFTVQELMWSAITVGRANIIDVLSHGIYSEYEILYRASIIVANLSQNGINLFKSSAYEHLDPSEKSAVSYFLGLTFTKLLCAKRLNIPWLLHIDVYREQFSRGGQAFRFGSSRSRPDLIGLDIRRNWTVIESKGRTNKMERNLLNSAKNQTQNLRQIGGQYPNLRIAIVTHFINGQLTVDWSDPLDYNEENFNIETNSEEFLFNYYKIIFNVLQTNEKSIIELDGFLSYSFDAINLTIGLDKNIYNAYEKKDLAQIQPKYELNSSAFKAISDQEFYAGIDGILIGLGGNWNELIQSNKKFDE